MGKGNYHFDECLSPLWKGNVIYRESISFFPDVQTKEIKPAPLLHKPVKILSLCSSDLKTSYTEGKDYEVKDNAICLLPGSAMRSWEYDEFYTVEPGEYRIDWLQPKGRYVHYSPGSFHAEHQFVVTYEHREEWDGPVPQYAGHCLPNTIKKLENGKKLRILFYGDSITEGADASGFGEGFPPYMPIYCKLVVEQLKKHYPKCKIDYVNKAVGGWSSTDGLSDSEERVTKVCADLVVIAFGMNDASLTPEEHAKNVSGIMEAARVANPETECILVSTTLPNTGTSWFKPHVEQFQSALQEIQQKETGVAVACMTEMHKYLLSKKRFPDMSGNGINHPNDFLVRVYAQILSAVLIRDF